MSRLTLAASISKLTPTLGANYIIFDPAGIFILDEPSLVAERPRGQVGETW